MNEADLREISYNSPDYQAEVALRHAILRRPLGLSFSSDQLIAESDSYHIGCYVRDELVGCLVLKPMDAKTIQMRQVAVSEKFQGKGIGRLMVSYSEAFARALGFRSVVLHSREVVVPFYERLGYAAVGDGFVEVTIPHRAMVKLL